MSTFPDILTSTIRPAWPRTARPALALRDAAIALIADVGLARMTRVASATALRLTTPFAGPDELVGQVNDLPRVVRGVPVRQPAARVRAALASLILSRRARGDIERSDGAMSGMPSAVTARVIAVIVIVLLLLFEAFVALSFAGICSLDGCSAAN